MIYRVIDEAGELVVASHDMGIATRLLHNIARARSLTDESGIVLRFKPPARDWDCLAEVGREAGTPYGVDRIQVAVGMN